MHDDGGRFTHFNVRGEAHMVDVSAKAATVRSARAEGRITMAAATLAAIRGGAHRKGDALGVAQVAAIQAAKRTEMLIPLCHQIPLAAVDVTWAFPDDTTLQCTVTARTIAQTGVEMEALTAVSVGLLTVYDMCKSADRGMTIDAIRLLHKEGGSSGAWDRETA